MLLPNLTVKWLSSWSSRFRPCLNASDAGALLSHWSWAATLMQLMLVQLKRLFKWTAVCIHQKLSEGNLCFKGGFMVWIQGTAPGRDKRSPQSRATGKRAVVASQLDGTGVLNLTDHNNSNPLGSSLLNCFVAFNPFTFLIRQVKCYLLQHSLGFSQKLSDKGCQ